MKTDAQNIVDSLKINAGYTQERVWYSKCKNFGFIKVDSGWKWNFCCSKKFNNSKFDKSRKKLKTIKFQYDKFSTLRDARQYLTLLFFEVEEVDLSSLCKINFSGYSHPDYGFVISRAENRLGWHLAPNGYFRVFGEDKEYIVFKTRKAAVEDYLKNRAEYTNQGY